MMKFPYRGAFVVCAIAVWAGHADAREISNAGYTERALAAFQEGQTTVNDVRAALGPPAFATSDGVYVYNWQITPLSPAITFDRTKILRLQFDANGLLRDQKWFKTIGESSAASKAEESTTKQFTPDPENCIVYTSFNTPKGPFSDLAYLTLDGRPVSPLADEGASIGGVAGYYAVQKTTPGPHRLGIVQLCNCKGQKELQAVEQLKPVEFACKAGAIVFAQYALGLFSTRLEILDETKGKKSVLPRTQLLTFSEINLEGFSVLR